MTDEDNGKTAHLPLPTRVELLEARVRLIARLLKWCGAVIVSSLVAYVVGKLT
jgi:hypothetical protein